MDPSSELQRSPNASASSGDDAEDVVHTDAYVIEPPTIQLRITGEEARVDKE
jgi:hypothetical protein